MVIIANGPMRVKSAGFRPASDCRNSRRPRNNGHADFQPPEGFMVCRLCTEWIALEPDDDGLVECPNGHSFNLLEEHCRERETELVALPKSGLSPTQMGRLVEKIVYDLEDLGEHGRIPRLSGGFADHPHQGCLDFITDQRVGVEVKGVDLTAPTKAFNLAKREYRLAKDEALAAAGCVKALMLLVKVDFRTMTAAIYPRSGQRFKYWELGSLDAAMAVVSFELPDEYQEILGRARQAYEARLAASEARDAAYAAGEGYDDIPF